jgi:hypothetical protein
MEGLTVHCMVRNEPFVYYAVKSVYPYVEQILLYDTGSYDKYTLLDIRQLLHEDKENKIIFKQVPIEVDETKWTNKRDGNNYRKLCRESRGKKGKWWVRKMMITDTVTPYFLILDGDEVHYERSMLAFKRCVQNWPHDKVCGFVSLLWFFDISHTFHMSRSGRIFKTKETGMTNSSPNEIHTVKKTGHRIGHGSDCSFSVDGTQPYAHFERMLKPWRRDVHKNRIDEFYGALPEVMVRDMSFVRRFENESGN